MDNQLCPIAFTGSFLGTLRGLQRRPRVSNCTIRAATSGGKGRTGATAEEEGRKEDALWTTGKIRAPRRMRGSGRVGRGTVRVQGKYYRSKALPPNPPGLRVTSGTARGRRIKSPDVYLRPMMGKVREALFSMLDMFEVLRSDGSTLDLFAGSGSVGIESLSRGMGNAVFVDSSLECTETITENLEHCQFADRGKSICARVEKFVEKGALYNNNRHYDLITLTPPYEEVDYAALMNIVTKSDCVGEGTFVVVEYPVELRSLPPSIGQRLVGIRNRRYGRTVLALYACQPSFDIEPRPDEFIDIKRK